jgi:methylmalonyl-CoA/ethylmalonyl-CoA epimerase
MMGLVQVAQHAGDLDRAERFYTRLLGRGPVARFDPPGLLFYGLGEVRLLLESGAPSALIYLPVDDLARLVVELRESGVEIVSEPHLIFSHSDASLGPAGHDEWQAFIRDSEGNLVGLVEHRPTAP